MFLTTERLQVKFCRPWYLYRLHVVGQIRLRWTTSIVYSSRKKKKKKTNMVHDRVRPAWRVSIFGQASSGTLKTSIISSTIFYLLDFYYGQYYCFSSRSERRVQREALSFLFFFETEGKHINSDKKCNVVERAYIKLWNY